MHRARERYILQTNNLTASAETIAELQPIERGTVLQMDQAASAYQEVLGNIRECSMHTNLLCHNYLLSCCNRTARYETGTQHL